MKQTIRGKFKKEYTRIQPDKRKKNWIELFGRKFGLLTVVGDTRCKQKNGALYMLMCRCDCGGSKNVTPSQLLRGIVISCGCKRYRFKYSGNNAAFSNLYRSYRLNARNRSIEFLLNEDQFRVLTSGLCFYCGEPPSREHFGSYKLKSKQPIPYVCNGVDRINNAIGYELNNCVSCCRVCNLMKIDYSADFFIEHAKQIAENQKAKEVYTFAVSP